MKKLICALAKLVAALAVISALLYAAVLYWDKIMAVALHGSGGATSFCYVTPPGFFHAQMAFTSRWAM